MNTAIYVVTERRIRYLMRMMHTVVIFAIES